MTLGVVSMVETLFPPQEISEADNRQKGKAFFMLSSFLNIYIFPKIIAIATGIGFKKSAEPPYFIINLLCFPF